MNIATPEKPIHLGSTIRTCSAQATLQKILPLCKHFGITRVANITGLDSLGIPVMIAIRPNAKNLSTSQGKGLSLDLAKVSAIMESIELWHAENCPTPDLIGSFDELNTKVDCIDPRTLCISPYQFKDLNKKSLSWMRARDLANNQDVFIPHPYLSMDTTKVSPVDLVFGASTNGLASGNTFHEAACHALYELIERDATHRFQQRTLNDQQQFLLDLDSIESPDIKKLIAQIQAQHSEVYVWDMTSTAGVPTYQCTIADQSIARGTNVFAGKGSHDDKEISLIRAITEAAQVRLTFITGSRDDIFPSFYQQLLPAPVPLPKGTRPFEETHQQTLQADFESTLHFLINRLQKEGYSSVIVYDHTRPHLNVSVVHALVPGLNKGFSS